MQECATGKSHRASLNICGPPAAVRRHLLTFRRPSGDAGQEPSTTRNCPDIAGASSVLLRLALYPPASFFGRVTGRVFTTNGLEAPRATVTTLSAYALCMLAA